MSRRTKFFYHGLYIKLFLFLKVWLRLCVEGRHNVPKKGAYILALGGHRSYIDTPLAALTSWRPYRFIGAEKVFRIPILGWVLRALGSFPVERSMTDRQAMRMAQDLLEAGERLVIFPEGYRLEGPEITEMKEGAAFLSCRAQVPIVPVGIGGAARALPPGKIFIRPRKVVLTIGKPLFPPVRTQGQRVKRSQIKAHSEALQTSLQNLFDRASEQAGS